MSVSTCASHESATLLCSPSELTPTCVWKDDVAAVVVGTRHMVRNIGVAVAIMLQWVTPVGKLVT